MTHNPGVQAVLQMFADFLPLDYTVMTAEQLRAVNDQPMAFGEPIAMARVDDRDEVVRMLSRLPAQQRKVIVLRYLGDLTEARTAQVLGISVGTVKSASSRGLESLRSLYVPVEEGERS